MRRAVSSELRSGSSLRSDRPKAYPRPRTVNAPIQLEPSDLGLDGRRDEAGDRVAGREALADVGRRDGQRLDLEERDPLGAFEPREHVVEARAVDARTGRDAEACKLEHPLRLLPREEARELVRADEEDRIVQRQRLERVDRPRERVERDLGLLERRKRQLGEEEPDLRSGADVLVARILDDPHEQPVEVESLDAAPCELDVAQVRRVERAAEDADAHSHSSSSSPISTSTPRRMPAPRSASSSSSSLGTAPTTRKPRSVRRIRNDRRAGGAGR